MVVKGGEIKEKEDIRVRGEEGRSIRKRGVGGGETEISPR